MAIEVREATYYRWRKECGGLKAHHVRRPKELERENTRLKKLETDQALYAAIIREFTRVIAITVRYNMDWQ